MVHLDSKSRQDIKIIKDGYGEFELQIPVLDKFPPGSEKFIHLHNHTEYSLLDGMARIERGYLSIDMDTLYEGQKTLAIRAKELNQPGIAMTDHGTMGGYFRFYAECLKNGINPIIGCEFYLVVDSEQRGGKRPKERHIVLIAKNYEGIKSLFKLNKMAWTKGFYYKPHIDFKMLKDYCHGDNIIAMTACTSGIMSSALLDDKFTVGMKKAKKIYDALDSIFGKENVYLEFMPHKFGVQRELNKRLLAFADRYNIENVVATNDCHYCEKSDERPHEILVCVQSRTTLDDSNRFKFDVQGLYIKSRKEMKRSFLKHHPSIPKNFLKKLLDNTVEIHKRVHIEIPKRKNIIPVPHLEGKQSSLAYIEHLLKKGWKSREIEKLARRYAKREELTLEQAVGVYKKRLRKELKIVKDLGFVDYFLIVREVINYAKSVDIMVGPGRGSAASSLMCYLLEITAVDPVYYNLMFERFISHYKVTSPDIDIDFEDYRRDEVYEWAAERWGSDNVARIATYGVMKGRQVIKDVSRCFGVPYNEANQITKYVIMRSGGDARKSMTVGDSFEEFDVMKAYNKQYPEVKPNAIALEGTIRNAGIHACGFVPAPMDLSEIVPIETRSGKVGSKKRVQVIASTTKEAEALGLLKLDALGLKTLSVLKDVLRMVEDKYGKVIDLEKIGEEDENVFKNFSDLDYTGVFQFDSMGMRRLTRGFKYEGFEDIINMTALYRPGTMRSGLATRFIKIRIGDKKVKKIHPIYDEITKHTAGIFIFQEQISEAFYKLAGFKLAAADQLRVAIAKSHGTEVINRQREGFVKGCAENGLEREKSEKLFDAITQFGSYGFNKAHATAYATISYWCMYLKYYYPLEFAVALLNHEKDDDKVIHYIKWCNDKGINIKNPDINKSGVQYTIGKNKDVYIGVEKIKYVGGKAAESIIKSQPFKNFFDFLDRVDRRVVNKRVIESLIKAGAFKRFCKNISYMLKSMESCLNLAKNKKQTGKKKKFIRKMKAKNSITRTAEALIRREVLAMPSAEGAISLYSEFLDKLFNINPLLKINFRNIGDIKNQEHSTKLSIIAGEIIDLKYNRVGDFDKMPPDDKELTRREIIYEPQGSRYCNLDLEDNTGDVRVRVRPEVFKKVKFELEEGKSSVVMIKGRKIKGRELFMAEEVVNLSLMQKRIKEKKLTDRDRYFIKHPCFRKQAVDLIEKYNLKFISPKHKEGKNYNVIGLVSSIRGHLCKNDSVMAFVSIDGAKQGAELLLWSDDYDRYREILEKSFVNNQPLAFKVKCDKELSYKLEGIRKLVSG